MASLIALLLRPFAPLFRFIALHPWMAIAACAALAAISWQLKRDMLSLIFVFLGALMIIRVDETSRRQA